MIIQYHKLTCFLHSESRTRLYQEQNCLEIAKFASQIVKLPDSCDLACFLDNCTTQLVKNTENPKQQRENNPFFLSTFSVTHSPTDHHQPSLPLLILWRDDMVDWHISNLIQGALSIFFYGLRCVLLCLSFEQLFLGIGCYVLYVIFYLDYIEIISIIFKFLGSYGLTFYDLTITPDPTYLIAQDLPCYDLATPSPILSKILILTILYQTTQCDKVWLLVFLLLYT